jgi:N-acetylglutamate synthase-like GNAT family acetyltransferase
MSSKPNHSCGLKRCELRIILDAGTIRAACMVKNNCEDKDFPSHYIAFLVVQNGYKGSGIGGEILSHVLMESCTDCRDQGLYTAKIVPDNESSKALFSRHGFFKTEFGSASHDDWYYLGDPQFLDAGSESDLSLVDAIQSTSP